MDTTKLQPCTPDGQIQAACDKLMAEARAQLSVLDQAKLVVLEEEQAALRELRSGLRQLSTKRFADNCLSELAATAILDGIQEAKVRINSRLSEIANHIDHINGVLPF